MVQHQPIQSSKNPYQEYSESQEHSWMEFAGIHKDNPLFEDVLTEIAAYRNQLDTQNDAAEDEHGLRQDQVQ